MKRDADDARAAMDALARDKVNREIRRERVYLVNSFVGVSVNVSSYKLISLYIYVYQSHMHVHTRTE